MAHHKILFSNLGYARGISGRLSEHIRYLHRHFYCSLPVQKRALQQFCQLIREEKPDVCCLVEIDQGLDGPKRFNQLEMLISEIYPFSDIENKYGKESFFRSFAATAGKSNAFISKQTLVFEKLFFKHGIKRLIYKIQLENNITLFFAHFSLNKKVRTQQIKEAAELIAEVRGEAIFLGDFNILSGLSEIAPLLKNGLVLLNRAEDPTFFFHKQKRILDLCICTKNISEYMRLKVVQQSYTDHAALIIEIATV